LVDTSGNTIISENNGVATFGSSVAPSTNYTFRNKIINGNLKSARVINQRGATEVAPLGATGYTYDRWYYDGSTYLYQGIEDLNVNNGTYVISWVGDNLIAHWALEDDNDTTPPYTAGPDSALTWNSVSKNSTFTINESPEHGKHLWIRFSLDTGGDFANLDKVMVEEGTVATPFEHRPYGLELALCQRYYQNLLPDLDMPVVREGTNDVLRRATVPLKVTMRSSPTAVITNNTAFGTYSVASTSVDAIRCSCSTDTPPSVARVTGLTADAEL